MTMRQWDGIRNDQTDAGASTALGDAVGSSFMVEGEVRRRSGLKRLTANGAMAMGHFRTAQNVSWLMLVTTSGQVIPVAI